MVFLYFNLFLSDFETGNLPLSFFYQTNMGKMALTSHYIPFLYWFSTIRFTHYTILLNV